MSATSVVQTFYTQIYIIEESLLILHVITFLHLMFYSVCILILASMYGHIQQKHIQTHAHKHIKTHTHIRIHTHTHIHTQRHTHTYTHKHTKIHTHANIYTHS